MSNIKIVTAFYNIGRDSIKGSERAVSEYFSYFSFWSGIGNDLIVFTSKSYKDSILNIRQNSGMAGGGKTTVIDMNLNEFYPGLMDRVRTLFEHKDQTFCRKHPQNIECISPDYCVVTALKPFYVNKAKELNLIKNDDIVIWIDFGFNHGCAYYNKQEEFSFTIDYSQIKTLLDDKNIILFEINSPLSATSVLDVYLNMYDIFMGGIIVATTKGWLELYNNFIKGIDNANDIGLMDDDQLFLYYSYLKNKENYKIIHSNYYFDALDYIVPNNITLSHVDKKHKHSHSFHAKIIKKIKMFFK